jgi:hypothetical protein
LSDSKAYETDPDESPEKNTESKDFREIPSFQKLKNEENTEGDELEDVSHYETSSHPYEDYTSKLWEGVNLAPEENYSDQNLNNKAFPSLELPPIVPNSKSTDHASTFLEGLPAPSQPE